MSSFSRWKVNTIWCPPSQINIMLNAVVWNSLNRLSEILCNLHPEHQELVAEGTQGLHLLRRICPFLAVFCFYSVMFCGKKKNKKICCVGFCCFLQWPGAFLRTLKGIENHSVLVCGPHLTWHFWIVFSIFFCNINFFW